MACLVATMRNHNSYYTIIGVMISPMTSSLIEQDKSLVPQQCIDFVEADVARRSLHLF